MASPMQCLASTFIRREEEKPVPDKVTRNCLRDQSEWRWYCWRRTEGPSGSPSLLVLHGYGRIVFVGTGLNDEGAGVDADDRVPKLNKTRNEGRR